jgi:hypothetical protein
MTYDHWKSTEERQEDNEHERASDERERLYDDLARASETIRSLRASQAGLLAAAKDTYQYVHGDFKATDGRWGQLCAAITAAEESAKMTTPPEDRAMELARDALADILDYQRRLSPANITKLLVLTISNAIRQYHVEEIKKSLESVS